MAAETESELLANLQKCRCCFRILIDHQKSIIVDETIRNQFFSLTQINLLSSDVFSKCICQLCKVDLQTFSDLRKDLITKQNSLYELAGVYDADENDEEIEEEYCDLQMIEDLEKDKDFEEVILEQDDSDEIIYEDYDILEDEVQKLEKIEESDAMTEIDTEFNYFGESSEDTKQQLSLGDYVEQEMCKICDLEVAKDYFDEHVKLIHAGDNNCTECDIIFLSKILLQKHMNEEHTKHAKNRKPRKKQHYCPLCAKSYDYKKQLVDHVRSFHKKERNAQCNICKRWFYHRDLKKHISHVHGEKKISCEVCGKMYTCHENLKLHLKYHSEPQFTCEKPDCGKKFHQKTLFDHHMMKHQNERNISCSQCNNSFFTLRDLKRHNQRVHNKVIRKCFDCDMVFCRKDKYREHVIKSHKDLTDDSRVKILEQIKNLKWHE